MQSEEFDKTAFSHKILAEIYKRLLLLTKSLRCILMITDNNSKVIPGVFISVLKIPFASF